MKYQIILCLSFQIPGTWLFERTQPGWHHPFSLFLLPNKYLFGNCDFQVKFWCFLMQKNISRRRNFDQIEHIPETKCALVWGFHCFQQSWLFNSVGNQQNLTIRIQQNLEQCFKFDQNPSPPSPVPPNRPVPQANFPFITPTLSKYSPKDSYVWPQRSQS